MLSRYLINAGYLDENFCAGATPDDFVEVKATAGNFGDRFYMSSIQLRLVGQHFHLLHYRPLLTPKDAKHGIGTGAGLREDICHFQSL
jgi:hypothetical protein